MGSYREKGVQRITTLYRWIKAETVHKKYHYHIGSFVSIDHILMCGTIDYSIKYISKSRPPIKDRCKKCQEIKDYQDGKM